MAEHVSKARHADHNRLELLLFNLGGRQRFGINVLKIREVIPTPELTRVPYSHPAICGVAHLRGETLSVVDLRLAVGGGTEAVASGDRGSVIVAEFNRSMQGFRVAKVDRIVICDWKEVLPPPAGSGLAAYITGVTRIDDELIQILDVERILGEVIAADETPSLAELVTDADRPYLAGKRVMVVDDSLMARNQTAHTLDAIGVDYVLARDGVEALRLLRQMLEEGEAGHVDMIISDIEMPEMDGYSLTLEVRDDKRLADTYILLHTSLNGVINTEKAHQAGADDALTKFVPTELARAVVAGLARRRA